MVAFLFHLQELSTTSLASQLATIPLCKQGSPGVLSLLRMQRLRNEIQQMDRIDRCSAFPQMAAGLAHLSGTA